MLSKKEDQVWKAIRIGSDNNPGRPEFPPQNPHFPATPTKRISVPGFSSVYVKDDSVNPWSHTHKDRMAWEIVCQYKYFLTAKKDGIIAAELPQFSMISSGNAALAVGLALKEYGLPKAKVLLDKRTRPEVIDILKRSHCEIYLTDLTQKPLTTNEILQLTKNEGGFDITSNEALNRDTIFYDWMSYEIVNQEADYVLVPFGSGELFENICNVAKREAERVSGHDPRLRANVNKLRSMNIIGATVNRPTTKAYMLYAQHRPFSHFNAPWLRYYKTFGCIGSESDVYIVQEASIEEAYRMLNEQGIHCSYSAASGLAYLLEHRATMPHDARYLAVSTGLGINLESIAEF